MRVSVVHSPQKIRKSLKNPMDKAVRQRLHEADPFETGTKLVRISEARCVYTGSSRSTQDRFLYLVPNGFTYESDPVWNCTVPGWYCVHVNPTEFRRIRARLDPIHIDLNCTDLV